VAPFHRRAAAQAALELDDLAANAIVYAVVRIDNVNVIFILERLREGRLDALRRLRQEARSTMIARAAPTPARARVKDRRRSFSARARRAAFLQAHGHSAEGDCRDRRGRTGNDLGLEALPALDQLRLIMAARPSASRRAAASRNSPTGRRN
jgi:hypothetical protein